MLIWQRFDAIDNRVPVVSRPARLLARPLGRRDEKWKDPNERWKSVTNKIAPCQRQQQQQQLVALVVVVCSKNCSAPCVRMTVAS